MPVPATTLRVVVVGADGEAVAAEVVRRREVGQRVAGFVGTDEELARAMGEEVLGGVDEVVRVRDGSPPG